MGKGYTGFAYVLVFMLGFYISHPCSILILLHQQRKLNAF
jgi:hypothetical protein